METVLVLNGPNLNLLGTRNPEVYGTITLAEIEERLLVVAGSLGVELVFFQGNGEGEMIDAIQGAYDAMVINPGAYAHYSIAIRDAIEAVARPCVEVHISNIFSRESFRAVSVLSPVVTGVISGLGAFGYELALAAVVGKLAPRQDP